MSQWRFSSDRMIEDYVKNVYSSAVEDLAPLAAPLEHEVVADLFGGRFVESCASAWRAVHG